MYTLPKTSSQATKQKNKVQAQELIKNQEN
jgi:hypothetical protein